MRDESAARRGAGLAERVPATGPAGGGGCAAAARGGGGGVRSSPQLARLAHRGAFGLHGLRRERLRLGRPVAVSEAIGRPTRRPFRSVLSCTAFDSVRSVALGRVVPPAAAHAAGLCAAPPLVRRAFASDPDNWVYAERAVFADGRRGRGPDGWLPTRNACWYARAQLRIRQRYGLTVTEAEARALEALLDRCGEAGRRPACG